MDRRTTSKPLDFSWRRGRVRDFPRAKNDEYHGNPSEMARQNFNHVLSIGKSRCRTGYSITRSQGMIGYLIHYMRRGQLWHRMDGREFRVSEGGACLLELSKPFDQGNDQPQVADLWWFRFNGPEMPRLAAQLGIDRNPVFDHLPRERFQSIFRQLWMNIVRQPAAHEARCHALLAALMAELFIARVREEDIVRQLGHEPQLSERMHAAIDYIIRYSPQRVGLKDIANGVGLNLYHFARRFRREVGMAPIQYLTRVRLEQARQLLTATNKSIGEISHLVGIPDQGYFARLFRKQVGQSPQAYREKHRSLAPHG